MLPSDQKRKRSFFLTIIFIVALVILGSVIWISYNKSKSSNVTSSFKLQTKNSPLNRSWSFIATDRIGTPTTSKISFSIVSADKTNQIYVKNKPIRTTSNKAFLVLSLELKNDSDKRVYFYSSDFVRLATNDGKKFEADFKNPRLEVAPLSTKKDRLAFLVNEGNKFELQIGEIVNSKETITVNF